MTNRQYGLEILRRSFCHTEEDQREGRCLSKKEFAGIFGAKGPMFSQIMNGSASLPEKWHPIIERIFATPVRFLKPEWAHLLKLRLSSLNRKQPGGRTLSQQLPDFELSNALQRMRSVQWRLLAQIERASRHSATAIRDMESVLIACENLVEKLEAESGANPKLDAILSTRGQHNISDFLPVFSPQFSRCLKSGHEDFKDSVLSSLTRVDEKGQIWVWDRKKATKRELNRMEHSSRNGGFDLRGLRWRRHGRIFRAAPGVVPQPFMSATWKLSKPIWQVAWPIKYLLRPSADGMVTARVSQLAVYSRHSLSRALPRPLAIRRAGSRFNPGGNRLAMPNHQLSHQ